MSALSSGATFSCLYNYPMFLESAFLLDSEESGRRLIPNALAGSIGGLSIGFWIRRTGRYWWLNVFASGFPMVAAASIATLRENSPVLKQWLAITPGESFNCPLELHQMSGSRLLDGRRVGHHPHGSAQLRRPARQCGRDLELVPLAQCRAGAERCDWIQHRSECARWAAYRAMASRRSKQCGFWHWLALRVSHG
jgi:hypothetical protein